jgi:hypothetical protein
MSDRTILNPVNANSLNGIFNGSGTISVQNINASAIATASISASGSVGFVAPSSEAYAMFNNNNILVVKGVDTTITPTLQLTNTTNTVSLSCPSNGVLQTTGVQLTDTSGSVLVKPIDRS